MNQTTPDFGVLYRLQLTKDFRFEDVIRLLPYFQRLGVTHLYLSPIFESNPGSNHGYDAVDPQKVSEERGGEVGFYQLAKALQDQKVPIRLVVDIVPNHMGVGWANPYWRDLLKTGPNSEYASVFDVHWSDHGGKVVLPVLGEQRSIAVDRGDIRLGWISGEGVVVRYYDQNFPVRQESYSSIFKNIEGFKNISDATVELSTVNEKYLDEELAKLDKKLIHEVLEHQHYELCFWREGIQKINYRRFFDINELAAVHAVSDQGFQVLHGKLSELIQKTCVIDALRIDHIDGLNSPRVYLERLQSVHPHFWIEKILEPGEQLPQKWPTLGTTGYDFSGQIAATLVFPAGFEQLHAHFIKSTGISDRFENGVEAAKDLILRESFPSEHGRMARRVGVWIQKKRNRTIDPETLHEVARFLVMELPVYRTYFERGKAGIHHDLKFVIGLKQKLGHQSVPANVRSLLDDLIDDFFETENFNDPDFMAWVEAWQQLAGPVMAKGLEDTLLYRLFPLTSLCEVGAKSTTEVAGGRNAFEEFITFRQRHYPYSMNTSTTHDSKRSEDTRNRIHALSELASEWAEVFEEFREMNLKWREQLQIDPGTHWEWFLYQTLIGTWPLDIGAAGDDYRDRIQGYLLKSTREAKRETSWMNPEPAFEKAIWLFVEAILNPDKNETFLKRLDEFSRKVAFIGALNSLSALVLKYLSPGVPDIYQGCEVWNYSLVDPDNRRPVPFDRLQKLDEETANATPVEFMDRWQSGALKFMVTRECIQMRREFSKELVRASFVPLPVVGDKRDKVIAFLREDEKLAWLVVVTRWLGEGVQLYGWQRPLGLPSEYWEGTTLELPAEYQDRRAQDRFTGRQLSLSVSLGLDQVLTDLNVAVLQIAKQ